MNTISEITDSKSGLQSILHPLPRYCIYALLIFTPLARGSVQPWAVTTIHLVTLLALAVFIISRTISGEFKWIKTPLDWPIACLLALCTLSTLFSVHRYTSFWALMLLVNYIVIFYLAIHTIRTRSHHRQVVYLIAGVGGFLAVFGLIKFSGLNPFSWWEYPDVQIFPPRLSSTYGNANHLAGYMEMAIPLLMAFFISGVAGVKRILLIGCLLAMSAALALTLSRSAWIGTMAALTLLAAFLFTARQVNRIKIISIFIIVLVASLLFVLLNSEAIRRIGPIDQPGKLEGRIHIWKNTIEIIKKYPFWGTGPGTYDAVFTKYQPVGIKKRYFSAHNDYLEFSSELGVIFVGLVSWMFFLTLKKVKSKWKSRSRLVRACTLGGLSGVTGILLHSVTDFNLQIPANAVLFVILLFLSLTTPPQMSSSKKQIFSF